MARSALATARLVLASATRPTISAIQRPRCSVLGGLGNRRRDVGADAEVLCVVRRRATSCGAQEPEQRHGDEGHRQEEHEHARRERTGEEVAADALVMVDRIERLGAGRHLLELVAERDGPFLRGVDALLGLREPSIAVGRFPDAAPSMSCRVPSRDVGRRRRARVILVTAGTPPQDDELDTSRSTSVTRSPTQVRSATRRTSPARTAPRTCRALRCSATHVVTSPSSESGAARRRGGRRLPSPPARPRRPRPCAPRPSVRPGEREDECSEKADRQHPPGRDEQVVHEPVVGVLDHRTPGRDQDPVEHHALEHEDEPAEQDHRDRHADRVLQGGPPPSP